jgi:cytoskeletal protein CcmA (bactofilin family)
LSDTPNIEHIVIDPVAMNIVNRVAPDCKHSGHFSYKGGLLLEGEITGTVKVEGGPLIIMGEGAVFGEVYSDSDVYLFGTFGGVEGHEYGELTVNAKVILAETAKGKVNIAAKTLRTFEGAKVHGSYRTLVQE